VKNPRNIPEIKNLGNGRSPMLRSPKN